MSWLPEDIREASGGEMVDSVARDTIRLAHRALGRFPELVKRHKYVAGGAAISSSLIVLAGVAVAQRMRRGATAEEAVSAVTSDELEGLVRYDDEDPEVAPGDEVVAEDGTASESLASAGIPTPPLPAMPAMPVYSNGSRPDADPGRDPATREH